MMLLRKRHDGLFERVHSDGEIEVFTLPPDPDDEMPSDTGDEGVFDPVPGGARLAAE